VATGVAGFVGTLTVFVLGYGLAYVVRRRGSHDRGSPDAAAAA
jgi:hypothetical protein